MRVGMLTGRTLHTNAGRVVFVLFYTFTVFCPSILSRGQQAPHLPAPTTNGDLPQLIDITPSTGIRFNHLSSPEKKYIVESMSGGVALIDYDRDGWPDIYFTNAPGVDMALAGKKARSALYHNNHDGTFTDVTEKAGVGYPCWAMGASIGDYDNDGWPDLLVTCFGGVVLYRNNLQITSTTSKKARELSAPSSSKSTRGRRQVTSRNTQISCCLSLDKPLSRWLP